jgi:hypothetical protein
VKRASAARDSLHHQTRAFIDEHRHISGKQERRKKRKTISCFLAFFRDFLLIRHFALRL